MPRRLKTLWVGDSWKMFTTEDEHDATKAGALIPIPTLNTINSNPTYIKYMNRHLANIAAATSSQNNTLTLQHEPGYHRVTISTVFTLLAGVLALGVGFAKLATSRAENSEDPLKEPLALTSLIGGALLIIAAAGLSVSNQVAQDKLKREKEQFENLLKLKKDLREVQQEIDLKTKCINLLIDTLITNEGLINLKLETRGDYFIKITQSFDTKDDLDFYENIHQTLLEISKSEYSLNSTEISKIRLIKLIMLEILKGNFAKEISNRKINVGFLDNLGFNKNLYKLFESIKKEFITQISELAYFVNYIFATLGNILANQARLFALKDLIILLSECCQFKLISKGSDWVSSLIKLCFDTLDETTNYLNLQRNIQALLTKPVAPKVEILTKHFNKFFRKQYKSFAEIFSDKDNKQLASNVKMLVTILADEYFLQKLTHHAPDGAVNFSSTYNAATYSYSTSSYQKRQAQEDYIKLQIENNNSYFKKDYREKYQAGWNCGDIALGIERNWLVQTLLKNAQDKDLRKLLVPEIKTAILLGSVAREEIQSKEEEIISLLDLQEPNADENLTSFIEQRLRELTADTLEKSAIINKRALELAFNYQQAHEKMKSAVRLCNIALGYKESKFLSLQELDQFFADNNGENQRKHKKAYNAYRKQRERILKPVEDAFNQYCSNIDVFKNYVSEYYGGNQWMVYHPDVSGQENASIFDAIAYLKNIKIVICKAGNDGEIIIDHETRKYGKDTIYIFYNGHNHFIALKSVTNKEYNFAISKEVDTTAQLLLKQGFLKDIKDQSNNAEKQDGPKSAEDNSKHIRSNSR